MDLSSVKTEQKLRRTGVGVLSRPLHGTAGVDKCFYGLLHLSTLGGLIRNDTKESWAQLTASLSSGGDAGAVAAAMEELGTQGPSRAKSAPRSLRRALLMPQVSTGYRCGERT